MSDFKLDIRDSVLKNLSKATLVSLEQTAEYLHQDLVLSQTMPFDKGTLQGESTFVDNSDVGSATVALVSATPYARRLYFHPEYNFNKKENPKAGAKWLEPYIKGDKKNLAQDSFRKLYKRNTGV